MPDSDTDSDTDSDLGLSLLLDEPASFRPSTAPPTSLPHTLSTAPHETLTIHLVGHNPLWGHHLWHAGVVLSRYLETHSSTHLHNRTVLELGAGAGLPSLVASLRGARSVLVTDYPDPPLIENLRLNIAGLPQPHGEIKARGCLWGAPLDGRGGGWDTVLLSDLLFNHSEHAKLCDTVVNALEKVNGRALVFFTPHRPWLLQKDLAFFGECEKRGLVVEKVLEEMMEGPMFEEDRGDRDLRRTVFGYEVRWGGRPAVKGVVDGAP